MAKGRHRKVRILVGILLVIAVGISSWWLPVWRLRDKSDIGASGYRGPDYLLRIVSLGSNTGRENTRHAPLPAIRFFGPGVSKGRLDYAGVRPVLNAMMGNDPIFRSAYKAFLRESFENNRRLAPLNGNDFFVPAGYPGSERFAAAILAGGGIIDPRFLADDVGYTWETMYNSALYHAREALQRGEVEGKPEELARLEHLIAIGMLAAIGNRFLPREYVEEWSEQNAELLAPIVERLKSDTSGDENDKAAREALVYQLPWLFHVTGMPRPPWRKDELARYYDSFHFFSYAWYGVYTLYRASYWGRFRGFKYHDIGRFSANVTILKSILISVGFELESTVLYRHGFLEMKDTDECGGLLAGAARKLGIEKLPFYEAFDDLRMDRKGCIFGCAAFLYPQTTLDPTDFNTNRSVMFTIGPLGLWEMLIILFILSIIGFTVVIIYLLRRRIARKKRAKVRID